MNLETQQQKEYNHDLIDYLVPRLFIFPDQTALDVGTGDGYLLSKLNCHKFKIEKGGKKISKKFDYIFLLDVIEHLQLNEIDDYFKYFARSLNFFGKLIISTPNINNFQMLSSFWDAPTHVRPFSSQTISDLAEVYGFFVYEEEFGFYKHPRKVLVNFLLGTQNSGKKIYFLTKQEY